MLSAKRLPQ